MNDAYTAWKSYDGPVTLEALLSVRITRLRQKYQDELEHCIMILKNFREDGKYGFVVTRQEEIPVRISVCWKTGAQVKEEIIKTELHRDPKNQYKIPDAELARQLESLVPFKHWLELSIGKKDEKMISLYECRNNDSEETVIRRLARRQDDFFRNDSEGEKYVNINVNLNIDTDGGMYIQKESNAKKTETTIPMLTHYHWNKISTDSDITVADPDHTARLRALLTRLCTEHVGTAKYSLV